MSRTGNKLINIVENVELKIESNSIFVKGPKGELTMPKFSELDYKIEDKSLSIARKNNNRSAKEKHGLSRTLIANAVNGVTIGFEKQLILHGIGYRVQLKGNDLEFSLGYSHPILFKAQKT